MPIKCYTQNNQRPKKRLPNGKWYIVAVLKCQHKMLIMPFQLKMARLNFKSGSGGTGTSAPHQV